MNTVVLELRYWKHEEPNFRFVIDEINDLFVRTVGNMGMDILSINHVHYRQQGGYFTFVSTCVVHCNGETPASIAQYLNTHQGDGEWHAWDDSGKVSIEVDRFGPGGIFGL